MTTNRGLKIGCDNKDANGDWGLRWVYDDKCSTYESEEENGVEPCKRISSSKSDEKKKKQLKLTLTLKYQLKFFNFFLSITSLIDDFGSLPSTCSSREVEKDVDIGIAFKLLEAFE